MMKKRMLFLSGLFALLLAGCSESQITEPGIDLRGRWAGQVDENPMKMEISVVNGSVSGTFSWRAGNPEFGAEVREVRRLANDSVQISLARLNSGGIIVTLRGKMSRDSISGTYIKHEGDVPLQDSGSWNATRVTGGE